MSMSQTLDFCLSNIKAGGSSRNLSVVDRLLARGKSERFVQVMNITPAIASEMMGHNTHNRSMVTLATAEYARMMRDGHWRLTIEAIAFDRTGTLANGQHRLDAIIASETTVPMTVWFGIEADEFLVIDQGRKRTSAHLVALNGQSSANTRASIAGMILMIIEEGFRLAPAILIAEKSLSLSADGTGYFDESVTISLRMSKVTNATSAGLAAFFIFKSGVAPISVQEFFRKIAHGEGLTGPMYRLREALVLGKLSAGNGQSVAVKRAAAIIHTWNAVRAGRKTVSFDWPHTSKLPEVRK